MVKFKIGSIDVCRSGLPPGLLVGIFAIMANLCTPMVHGSDVGPKTLLRQIDNRDAILLIDSEDRVVVSKNSDLKLVPASILKVLTSLVALHYLGENHRFMTQFYLDDQLNLKVKGYGDPMLTSESLLTIARDLASESGLPKRAHIKDLVLDGSFFQHTTRIPGQSFSLEPYDAPNAALCANFNTVNFKRDAQGRYVSAEPQTPLLASALERIHKSGLAQGRITFSHRENENMRYFGDLLAFFLNQSGVSMGGRIRVDTIDLQSDRLILRYQSIYDLRQVVSLLLDYSNNFIANQLLIAVGARVFGSPGTLSKGVRATHFYADQKLGLSHLQIVEGSGLSRQNRISAEEMAQILKAFAPYRHLMPWSDGELYKTGTLNGIKTRAGYIEDPRERWWRFVVMLNSGSISTWRIMKHVKQLVEES